MKIRPVFPCGWTDRHWRS